MARRMYWQTLRIQSHHLSSFVHVITAPFGKFQLTRKKHLRQPKSLVFNAKLISNDRYKCGNVQGQMSGDDLSAAYASGDVFMMPSESETLGFVALEAMASGLPVVAVAAGGLTDILTHPGVTGVHTCAHCASACSYRRDLVVKTVACLTGDVKHMLFAARQIPRLARVATTCNAQVTRKLQSSLTHDMSYNASQHYSFSVLAILCLNSDAKHIKDFASW